MEELITIIVPVYKVEDYLDKCVNSLLNQTYKNLEIILVDDGSPDRCGEMCDEYAKIDNRVKVIHKENGGLSDARNAGIEVANGQYLAFLDSDDWVHEEFVEKLYRLIKETESNLAICNFVKTSGEDITPDFSDVEIHELSNIEALEKLAGEFYLQFVVAWGKLYHKDLFDLVRYPVGKVHEDEYVAHKILYKTNKVVYTTEQLVYYRQRQDSITGSGYKIKNRIDALEALMERADFYGDIGLDKARDEIYKGVFFIYKQIIEYNDKNNEFVNKQAILGEFKSFRAKLREGNHNIKFKIFYELYYLFPSMMKLAFKLWKDK